MGKYHNALLYGSKELNLTVTVLEDPRYDSLHFITYSTRQHALHYQDSCVWAQEISFGNLPPLKHGGCQGISALLYPFSRDLRLLSGGPDDDLVWNNTYFISFYNTATYCKYYFL